MSPTANANAIVGTLGMLMPDVYKALAAYAEERFREIRNEVIDDCIEAIQEASFHKTPCGCGECTGVDQSLELP